MATSFDQSRNQYQIEHLHQHVYHPENLVKIGLVVSEISLLQTVVKNKKMMMKEVTEAKHKPMPAEAWRAN